MGYRPQIRAPRKYGRRRGNLKAKAKGRKRRSSGSYLSEENRVQTSEEVVDRTLNRLRNLGNQRFGLFPFSEHFNLWLWSLWDTLSELDSSPNIDVDDQFVKERSQILADIELKLEERRRNENSQEEAAKNLLDMRMLIEQIEEEYAAKMKETERRRNSEINRLSSNIGDIREEMDRIARMKTGIFRRILKNITQKEAEATQRLNSAEKELMLAMQGFASEQDRLRNEYETRKQPIIERIDNQQKEAKSQEVDGSLEDRHGACEALINAVEALLKRNLQIRNT